MPIVNQISFVPLPLVSADAPAIQTAPGETFSSIIEAMLGELQTEAPQTAQQADESPHNGLFGNIPTDGEGAVKEYGAKESGETVKPEEKSKSFSGSILAPQAIYGAAGILEGFGLPNCSAPAPAPEQTSLLRPEAIISEATAANNAPAPIAETVIPELPETEHTPAADTGMAQAKYEAPAFDAGAERTQSKAPAVETSAAQARSNTPEKADAKVFATVAEKSEPTSNQAGAAESTGRSAGISALEAEKRTITEGAAKTPQAFALPRKDVPRAEGETAQPAADFKLDAIAAQAKYVSHASVIAPVETESGAKAESLGKGAPEAKVRGSAAEPDASNVFALNIDNMPAAVKPQATEQSAKPPAEIPQAREFAGENAAEIVESIEVNALHGKREFTVSLKPEFLGKMTIKLTVEKGTVKAELKTADEAVRSLIAEQVPEIKQALADRGVNVAQFDVTYESPAFDASGQFARQNHEPRTRGGRRAYDAGAVFAPSVYDALAEPDLAILNSSVEFRA